MITADLARVPALTVLERERVDALLRELRLADSGLVDRATLGPPAALLGAGTVVSGTLLNEPGPAGLGNLALGRYRINAAAFDMRQARVFATPEADGSQARFFVLQKQIVNALLQALGHDPMTLESLSDRTGWDAAHLQAQLMELELLLRPVQQLLLEPVPLMAASISFWSETSSTYSARTRSNTSAALARSSSRVWT